MHHYSAITRLFSLILLPLCSMAFACQAQAGSERWTTLKNSFFGEKQIIEGETIITMEAPKRAYDAATVPIVIRAVDGNQLIKQVHLIVDKNPLPLAGIFKFSEQAGNWEWLETRIRINEYTNVRAVAELADGSLHMTTRFVKASGGCSAPAMADLDAAMARAGKMKLSLNRQSDGSGNAAEATIKISHPNNSGMQFDQVSRNYIPAFFVQNISAQLNNKPLIDIETNFSMSENPVLRFHFSPAQEINQSPVQMLVHAVDSKGNRYENSADLTSQ